MRMTFDEARAGPWEVFPPGKRGSALREEPLRYGLGRKLGSLELSGDAATAHNDDAVADMQHFLQFRRHDDERLALIRQ